MKQEKVYYGWKVVVCAFMCLFFGQLLYTNVMGVYTKAITEQFGWERAQFTLWTSVSAIVMMISSPIIGKLYQKYPMKKVMCMIVMIMSSGYLGFACSSQLWHFYMFAVLMGVGFAGYIRMGPSILVNLWFGPKLKSMAMAIVTTSTTFGTLIIVPMITNIVGKFGWRAGYFTTVGINLLVVIPVFWFIIDTPESKGIEKQGMINEDEKTMVERDGVDLEPSQVLKLPEFYLFGAAQLLCAICSTGILTNVQMYFTDIGFNSAVAAWITSASWATAFVGRFIVGGVCKNKGVRTGITFCAAAYTFSMIGLFFTQYNMIFGFLYAAGYAVGSCITILVPPLMTPTMWGAKNNARNYGLVNFCSSIGTIFGATAIALVYDMTGTYSNAWLALAGIFVLAGILFYLSLTISKKRNSVLRAKMST